MIAEQLDGRRIAITGGTGFLGTALIERLLRSVPGCQLVLLIRPGRRSTVQQRAKREIFGNNAFDRLRSDLGRDGFAQMVEDRVTAIAGDVGTDGLGLDDDGRAALAFCDVVIHSAATVSFDSPLDAAVEVNLLGPTRIVEALHDLGVTPHLVSVSTCYVAGNRRGSAPEIPVHESPFFIDVDWRGEVRGARQARADAEADSRRPESLVRFRKEARAELGAAGVPALAGKTEQRRSAWVKEQMVEAGRARAASLGWPDAYAYTKALGERALLQNRGDVPVSIVRPSIIESAIQEPYPGWIRGFRMAEPVIISFARGLLKEFPGVPEGTVDVIPVDLVVAAIIDAAAGDPPSEPAITQVASGSVNPLRYRHLVDMVTAYFTEHPVYDAEGQPIIVPEWSFPGRGRVQRQLERAQGAIERGERVLQALPLRGKQAAWAATLEEKREEVDRALAYVELYGAYAECEAIYGVDRLLERWSGLDPEDQVTFCFDPRVIDWDHYAPHVHLPSVVEHSRVRTTPGGRTSEKREDRLRRQVLDPARHFAAFDLENTLIASNVVASYSWLATRRLPPEDRIRFVFKTLKEAPALLAADRRDRSDFLRHFYRRYDGADVEQLEADAVEMFSDLILTKSFPAAVRRVREHRALGHRTVLITGALDLAIGPLRPLFDDIVAPSLAQRADGTYRGELTDVPPTGEARASALFDYAEANGFDVAEGVAYADSTSDLPMLEAVGFPVAVNPETRLAALARKRGWLVEHFDKAKGAPRPLLPIGPEWGRPRRRRVGKVDTIEIPREVSTVKALVFSRKPAKFAAAVVAGRLMPGGGAKVGPLSLRDVDPPELPGPDWVRLRPRLSGICGSDLATIDGTSSRWFEPIVSFPFTPGHEVIGELDDGQRAVVVPVLSCVPRGISPVCPPCAEGRINHCERIGFGELEPGLQCGFCETTGGGWSTLMVAHESQLVAVPTDMSDEAAVLVEPTACAVHAAAQVDASRVALIGSGTLGLLTIAALRQVRPEVELIATAKHPHQRALAAELGADVVVAPGELERAVRSRSGTMRYDNGQLGGGAEAVVDCVGSAESIAQALRIAAPGATIHTVGMPGVTTVDLTPLWQREVALRGAYAYQRADFDRAIELVQRLDLGRLVTATYPLRRYEDAITHAASAGARGAVKIAFDLRSERERDSI